MLRVGFVAGDFGDAHAILLARADADGRAVLHVEDGVGGDARLDEPPEEKVVGLALRRGAADAVLLEGDRARRLVNDLARRLRQHEVDRRPRLDGEGRLHDEAAVHQTLEIKDALRHIGGEAIHVADAHDAQVLLRRENLQDARLEIGRDDDFGVVLANEFRRLDVAGAVERDRAAEGREAVGLVRLEVSLGERRAKRDAAGVVVLDDDRARREREVAEDVERVVRVGDVRLPRMLPRLEQLR